MTWHHHWAQAGRNQSWQRRAKQQAEYGYHNGIEEERGPSQYPMYRHRDSPFVLQRLIPGIIIPRHSGSPGASRDRFDRLNCHITFKRLFRYVFEVFERKNYGER